jgi:hypothetical protein
MVKVIYRIVEHDGGWAYKVGDVFSETFLTHAEATSAARIAAGEQQLGGATEGIEYQDERGEWHEELSPGGDRPETKIED